MKKILAVAAVALLTVTCAQAQKYEYSNKHEVAISYGRISNSDWIDTFEKITSAIFNEQYDNDSYIGPFSVEYFYRMEPWLCLGGIMTYGKLTQDVFRGKDRDEKEGDLSNTYFSVMPAVKLDWLRSQYFGLYSKLAVGATLRSEKIDYKSTEYKDHDKTSVHLNWQASAIGAEAGSPTVRGFFELGVGEQGMAVIGLRCKF